jgi:peptidoglycan-N-acetylglucosamine deacetylase
MNIITFDLEEWYTYRLYPKGGESYYLPVINNYLDRVLNLLDEINTKATFFCLGIIAETHPQVIKKIYTRGHEIGCHSNKHQLVTSMSARQFKEDTHAAIQSLQSLTGEKVYCYRAPAFSITEKNTWAFEVLVEEGITTDCSVFPSARSFGGFPSFEEGQPVVLHCNGATLKEFPISFVQWLGKRWIFSGGGYFRLFPYMFTKKLMEMSPYNMAYFHIRDFDAKQKHVLSARYFYSYYGINGAYAKLENFLRAYPFISLGEAVAQVNWDKAQKVQLNSQQ